MKVKPNMLHSRSLMCVMRHFEAQNLALRSSPGGVLGNKMIMLTRPTPSTLTRGVFTFPSYSGMCLQCTHSVSKHINQAIVKNLGMTPNANTFTRGLDTSSNLADTLA